MTTQNNEQLLDWIEKQIGLAQKGKKDAEKAGEPDTAQFWEGQRNGFYLTKRKIDGREHVEILIAKLAEMTQGEDWICALDEVKELVKFLQPLADKQEKEDAGV